MTRPPTIPLIDEFASAWSYASPSTPGYRVIEAADGREGVRLFREQRPALVIADIVMPEKGRHR